MGLTLTINQMFNTRCALPKTWYLLFWPSYVVVVLRRYSLDVTDACPYHSMDLDEELKGLVSRIKENIDWIKGASPNAYSTIHSSSTGQPRCWSYGPAPGQCSRHSSYTLWQGLWHLPKNAVDGCGILPHKKRGRWLWHSTAQKTR